jgi:hypothetical protein
MIYLRKMSKKMKIALLIVFLIILAFIGIKTINAFGEAASPGKHAADAFTGSYEAGYYVAENVYYYTDGIIWQKYDAINATWENLSLSELTFLEDGKQYKKTSLEKIKINVNITASPLDNEKSQSEE